MSNQIEAPYDVVIVGGGPGGLSAALALGRGCKRVLLCDAGERRNAAAKRIHNFVTRDGTEPEEFRRVGREQLATYPNVDIRAVRVESITGDRGAFAIATASGTFQARRVLLCTGMVDDMLPVEGFRELWGRSIFQCPYCHGWEIRDRRWGYLARGMDAKHLLMFSLKLRAWTRDLVVFTGGPVNLPSDARDQLTAAGIRLETNAVSRLVGRDGLEAVELENGTVVACDALFTHPPQRQVEVVRSLGLELDDDGYVRIDPMTRETSIPGIYAGGDVTTRMQAAIFAAATSVQAAVMIDTELTIELATGGRL